MASQMLRTKTVWMLAVTTIFFLPLQSHPLPKLDLTHPALKTIGQFDDSHKSPGMRRLVWWSSSGNDEEETEPAMVAPLTTTESSIPVITEITTKKPSRSTSWFSAAKDKFLKAATLVKTGMSVVGNATKTAFIEGHSVIITGAKTIGNATINAGTAIKKGAKKFGSAVKGGFQKIRLKFSGSGEKFKILANRLKEKLESGDEKAIVLMNKLGIHINFNDSKISGSFVENKNISVTEVLREEGMLSNKSSAYHTNLSTNSTSTAISPIFPSTLQPAISTIPTTIFTTTIPSSTSTTSLTIPKITSIPTTTTLPTTSTTSKTTSIPTTSTLLTTIRFTITNITLPTTTHVRPSESTIYLVDEENFNTTPFPNTSEDKETTVEGLYIPPPFPDVFSDIEVHDRLREFYDNGDFSHEEMRQLFNFDPDNYEYYDYNSYDDYNN